MWTMGKGSATTATGPERRAASSLSRSGSRIRPVQAPCRSHTAVQATQVKSSEPPGETLDLDLGAVVRALREIHLLIVGAPGRI